MSKVVIYILDKFVWILIFAIFISQALQIAGFVEGPKDISIRELHFYNQQNNENLGTRFVEDANGVGVRGKRQAGDRSPLLSDSLFNLPMTTLNAVNEFIQNTRPVIQRIREAAERQNNATNEKMRKDKALKKVSTEVDPGPDGPEVQADGSSSRVLLRVN